MITEDQLEQLCLDWFRDQGWEYAYGPDIAPDSDNPERNDYRQVILHGRSLSALQTINPTVPIEKLEEVASGIAKPEFPVLIKSNHAFHKMLLEGVPITCIEGTEEKIELVRLIDFNSVEKNRFLIVNQFTVQVLEVITVIA